MTYSLTRDKWVEDANCAGFDPEDWFPPQGGRVQPIARRVCAACPVRIECLRHALEKPEEGVWGGLSETERKQKGWQVLAKLERASCA